MDTKLTLNLDREIIENAKSYAKQHQVSLSQLVENYFNSLTKKEQRAVKVSSLVESLTGVIPLNEGDDREDYRAYLNQKYS